jgi:protein O-mannosyl-transferase
MKFVLALALFVVAFASYLPLEGHTFHNLDDGAYVTANEGIRDGLTAGTVAWAFTTLHMGFYDPVTLLSHAADVQRYGFEPGGHYRTNIALHATNAVLLFAFLLVAAGGALRSFFGALLFALHPMNVESVAWVAERKNLLSALFLLLALIFYVLERRRREEGRRSGPMMAAYKVFFILGLLSKSSIVVFPLLLLVLDFWPLGRFAPGDAGRGLKVFVRLVAEKLPLFALSLVSGVLTILAQKSAGGMTSLATISVPQRIAGALLGTGFYLEKLVAPVRLCMFYPHHKGNYPALLPVGIFVALALATALFLKVRNRLPVLLAGWLFFGVSLLPVIGLLQVGNQAYADRYVYFPYWGLILMVAMGIPWKRIASAGPIAGVALVVSFVVAVSALSLCERAQLATWKDDEALFGNVVRVRPDAAKGYFQLANFYRSNGDKERAVPLYERALERYKRELTDDPDSGSVAYDVAVTLINLRKGTEAEAYLRLALEHGVDRAEIEDKTRLARFVECNRLWEEHAAAKEWDGAASEVRKALEIHPGRADAWSFLGYALQMKNDLDGAEAAYRKAIELDGSLDVAVHNLGAIELQKKALAEGTAGEPTLTEGMRRRRER